ncbi:serine hydrolase domain-containing protein [Flavobacterium sp. SM2513]|uniref:serine hydrolase domain-containing protein n=1 Tax=Flavobacterium sp. SM2513 TaxID=3424766 RepID=UPI003D7F9128
MIFIYICTFAFFPMNRFNTYLYSTLLILLFSLISCKEDKKPIKKETAVAIDTFPHILPNLEKQKKLVPNYVAENRRKIDLFYKKYWDKNNVSGGLLVAKDGQIIFERYSGYSNFDTKKEIDINTPIHLASVSKRITAAAIMILVNAKKLELDQKVTTVLPTFPYPEVTVRTLLNHRSGLKNYAYFFDDTKIWDHSKQVTNQDILDEFIKNNVPLDFSTDRRFAYCNTNYAMLALIIEKVTGLTYREAMKKIIFKPLKMDHTFVIDYATEYKNQSQSYKGNYRKHELNHLETVYGDKNIYSTPRDLLKFQQAVASKDYLTPDLVDEVFKGYSYEKRGTRNYGLGIRMMEWNDGKQLFYHNGWWHGNTTSYVDLRDENVIIIALSNKYTTMTYKSFLLATLFGDYPLKLKKDELGF